LVLAQAADPVSKLILNDDFSNTWLERNTLGMFGSGGIEVVGREMTADLRTQRHEAIVQAVGRPGFHRHAEQQGRFIRKAARASRRQH
jgi:hypothetical protein